MVDLLKAVRKMREAQTELLLHVHRGAVKLPENPQEREQVIKTLQDETQAFIDYTNKTVSEVDALIRPDIDVDDFSNGEVTYKDLKRQRDALFVMYCEMNAGTPWAKAFCYQVNGGFFILGLTFEEEMGSMPELKMYQLLKCADYFERCKEFAEETDERSALALYPQLPVLEGSEAGAMKIVLAEEVV